MLFNAQFISINNADFIFDIGRTVAARGDRAFVEGSKAYQKGGAERAFQELSLLYDNDTAKAVCQQIQDMLRSGWFGPYPQPEASYYSNPILHLSLSRQSSIASILSSYSDDRNMPPETVSRAISLSFQTIAKAAPFVQVQVGGTGDPLRNIPGLERVFETAAKNQNVKFNLLTCDGTTDIRPIALDRGMLACFDLGGTPAIQDKLCPMLDGSPSSRLVENNVRAWIESAGRNRAIARCQITGFQTDVSEIYQYLFELGFRRIRLQPLRHGNAPYAIDERNVGSVMSAYDRFVDLLLGMDDDSLLLYLNALWGPDLLGQLIVSLLTHTGMVSSCPAGKALLSVDVDGRVYACPRFSGIDACCIGTVEHGVDGHRRWPYLEELIVDRRDECAKCWARYACGGGCYYSGYRRTGDLKATEAAHCGLIRHIASLAIWLLDRVQTDRPQIIRSLLCRPLQSSVQTGLNCPLSDTPVYNRNEVAKRGLVLKLGGCEQMSGRVWRGPEEVSANCWLIADLEHIHICFEIYGLAFRPSGPIGKSDFINVRFGARVNGRRFAEYVISGDPASVVANDPTFAEGVNFRVGSLQAAGRFYWLILPWSSLRYSPLPGGLFGLNVHIRIKSRREEFGISCFPSALMGTIRLTPVKPH